MTNLEAMLEYQEIDSKLREIELEIEDNEDFKQAMQAKRNVLEARSRLDACEKKADELIASLDRLQKVYAELVAKITQIQQDASECDIDDDMDYMGGILQKLQENVATVEQELVQLNKQIEELNRIHDNARVANKRYKGVFDEKKLNYEKYLATKADSMKAIKDQLAAIAVSADPTMLEKYSRLRKEKVFPVLTSSRVEGTDVQCGACRVALDLNTINTLRTRGFVECELCHRIIYQLPKND